MSALLRSCLLAAGNASSSQVRVLKDTSVSCVSGFALVSLRTWFENFTSDVDSEIQVNSELGFRRLQFYHH